MVPFRLHTGCRSERLLETRNEHPHKHDMMTSLTGQPHGTHTGDLKLDSECARMIAAVSDIVAAFTSCLFVLLHHASVGYMILTTRHSRVCKPSLCGLMRTAVGRAHVCGHKGQPSPLGERPVPLRARVSKLHALIFNSKDAMRPKV